MNFYKKKLVFLLILSSMFAVANRIFDTESLNGELFPFSWLYGISMMVLFYLAFFIVTFKCPNPNCKKLQIYRGVSPKQWHWPEDKCYSCGTKLREHGRLG